MSNLMFASVVDRHIEDEPLTGYAEKKWISETGIRVIDPAPWITRHRDGKESHFQSGYSAHRFEIAFPASEIVNNQYDRLYRIALNFRTIDNVKISHVELHDGRAISWELFNSNLRGNFAYSIGPDNCWDFYPALPISRNLHIGLSVEFGPPKVHVPEFIFFAARMLVSASDYFSKAVNF